MTALGLVERPTAGVLRRALLVGGPVALAVWLLAPRAVLGFDALLHVVWARELVAGQWQGYDPRTAITPHPLQLLVAVPLAPLGGEAAAEVFRLLHLAALGALVAGTVELGRRLWSWQVGALTAALLVVQPYVLDLAHRGQADGPALALVVWAAVLEAARPRRGLPVLVLLVLAGLLRPEAWLLAGLYALWCRRLPLLLLAGAGPALWALTDLALAGDPLWSFTRTSELTAMLDRDTGLDRALPVGWANVRAVLGLVPVLAGLAGLLLVPRLGLRRLALPLALGAAGLVGFLVLAAAELSLQPRYLLLVVLALALLAAVLAVGWVGRPADPRWRRAGLVLLALLAVGQASRVPVTLGALAVLRADDRSVRTVLSDPRVVAALRDCGPVLVATAYLVPHVALALDVPHASVAIAPGEGLFLGPSPTSRTSVGGGVGDVDRATAPPPPGAVPVLTAEHWRVLAGCAPDD